MTRVAPASLAADASVPHLQWPETAMKTKRDPGAGAEAAGGGDSGRQGDIEGIPVARPVLGFQLELAVWRLALLLQCLLQLGQEIC